MRVDVALVHYPVVNRHGETIGSAVTNLDLHDIARAGKTYGVGTYWVITPFQEQRELAGQIVGHWTQGYGGSVNPDRSDALALVTVCASYAEALAGAKEKFGERPLVLATCAKEQANTLEYAEVRDKIRRGTPVLLLFGTAWGLSPELLAAVDGVLPPLRGSTGFNHLSVRSAAAIILDRLLGDHTTTMMQTL
ncbi:MAG: RNA methyltransferase [Proteobacteria bacterium]|nr:RNA methyltransferase [Pseudomonadota bacterium]